MLYNILGEKEMSEEWKKTRIFLLVLLLFGLISTSFIIGSGAPGTWKEDRHEAGDIYSVVVAIASGRYDSSGNMFDWAHHFGGRYWNSLLRTSTYLKVYILSDQRSHWVVFYDSTTGGYAESYPTSTSVVYTYSEASFYEFLTTKSYTYSISAIVRP
ncbi:MAG: hypothetical protein ACPLZG_09575 [Thermoproteota archaeon]